MNSGQIKITTGFNHIKNHKLTSAVYCVQYLKQIISQHLTSNNSKATNYMYNLPNLNSAIFLSFEVRLLQI
jgi:hypothetical protein